MAGRAWVNRAIQVGVETTPGTPVAANKRLPGLSFNISPEMASQRYRSHGYKFNTSSQIHRIHSTGDVEGPLSYEEIIYLLATMFTPPTPTTPAGGTNSREWLFTPLAQGNETPKTLTVEMGDSEAAKIAAHVACMGLTFNFEKTDVNVNGSIIGYAPTTGTMTGSPTAIAQIIAAANDIDVYIHSVLGAAGVTLFQSANKLTEAISGAFSIGDKFAPQWVHNTDYQSFRSLVEVPSELTMNYMSAANAQARALYDLITTNPLRYVGVRITGPIIEGAIPYMFELVAACKITAVPEQDDDGVYAYNFEFAPEIDNTLTSAFWVRVVNTRTAL